MSLIPAPYRWLAVVALIAAVFAFGWLKGAQHGERRLEKAQIAAEREATRLANKRVVVTTRIERKYLPQLTRERVVTETIIKEVDRYVPVSDCPLSLGFRVFHDAAASGEVPDPARITDGAAVTAKEAASTVAENYGACREDQLRLKGLQEWIREQQKVE